MGTLSIIDFNRQPSENEIVGELGNNGVLVLKDFCNKKDLEKLRSEFESLLSDSNKEAKWFENRPYSLGKAGLISKTKEMQLHYPATHSFFSNPLMQSITDKYIGSGYNANQKIFVVKDIVGTSHHANDLHFDVQRTLKFFLYLTDTTEKNGAFRCVPSSHKEAERIRKENPGQLSYENREFSRKLPFGPEHTVPVNGTAGSLIIFDTNVFHQAGKVSEGERWVMRGQTEPVPEPVKQLSFFKRIINKLSK